MEQRCEMSYHHGPSLYVLLQPGVLLQVKPSTCLYLLTHPMLSGKIPSAGEEKIFPIAQLGNRNKAVCRGSGVIYRALCSGTPGECHGGCGRWVPVTKQMDKVGNSPLLTDYGHLRQTRGGIYLLLAVPIRMFASRKHSSTHLIR